MRIKGMNWMKVGMIGIGIIVALFIVGTVVFFTPSISSGTPNDATAYAVTMDKPMFVDIDGDDDIDLLLPGGFIVYNNPPLVPPTK